MIWKRQIYMFAILTMLLGTWKGYVALYEKDGIEPIQIFPCSIESLPLADQSALEQGIPIRNQRDLQQVLEDYLS
jgi:hypothetical protein